MNLYLEQSFHLFRAALEAVNTEGRSSFYKLLAVLVRYELANVHLFTTHTHSVHLFVSSVGRTHVQLSTASRVRQCKDDGKN